MRRGRGMEAREEGIEGSKRDEEEGKNRRRDG